MCLRNGLAETEITGVSTCTTIACYSRRSRLCIRLCWASNGRTTICWHCERLPLNRIDIAPSARVAFAICVSPSIRAGTLAGQRVWRIGDDRASWCQHFSQLLVTVGGTGCVALAGQATVEEPLAGGQSERIPFYGIDVAPSSRVASAISVGCKCSTRVPSQAIGFGLFVMVGPVGVKVLPQPSNTAGGVGCVALAGQATVEAPFAGIVNVG